MLRDTAAKYSFIVESALPFSAESATGDFVLMRGMEMGLAAVPRHTIVLDCDLVQGVVPVGVCPALPLDEVQMILGNDLAGSAVWAGVPPPVVVSRPLISGNPSEDGLLPDVFPVCAVTRAQSRKMSVPDLHVPESGDIIREQGVSLPDLPPFVLKEDWVENQKTDSSLSALWEEVLSAEETREVARGYFVQGDLLVRKWVPCVGDSVGEPIFQVVVPDGFRGDVLKTAHDSCGYLGVKKTYDRVLRYFFWPGLKRDVARYVESCHVCQVMGKPSQVIKPAPLSPIPAVSQPFEHLIVDCVGPLPPSKSGCAYMLTVMCQTTRYPAAFPLRSISVKQVVRALTQFFSTFGIPRVIQTNQGSNFTSHMFKQILLQLGVKHNRSSAYHAQSQGALERFHQTLKSMLRANVMTLGKDWEEGLPWLMLAAREVVQESTGFSPNDLVFGHTVRGPLAVLQDGLVEREPPKNLVDYVNGFRRRLYVAVEVARENLSGAQIKMKKLYDRKSKYREFSPGDQVLALMPLQVSPFQARFAGPYTVSRKVSDQNYLISTPGRKKQSQLCHVNLLKPYYACGSSAVCNSFRFCCLGAGIS